MLDIATFLALLLFRPYSTMDRHYHGHLQRAANQNAGWQVVSDLDALDPDCLLAADGNGNDHA